MKHMDTELVTKDFLKETLSHEFEKFSTILVTEFGRMDDRFERVEVRLDRVENRLDNVENRLGAVEEGLSSVSFRLGKVENNLLELTETLEAEMAFTSDLYDDHEKRIGVLEKRRA